MWKPRLGSLFRLFQSPAEGCSRVASISTSPTNPDISDSGKVERKKSQRLKISEILSRVIQRDGLTAAPLNIQYLIGRASAGSSDGGQVSDTLDIADKTQLILQSSHPVRYIVERELKNLQHHRSNIPTQLTYHDWITIFSRSFGVSGKGVKQKFETQLYYVSNAAEAGMFSSDSHQTVINIPEHSITDTKLLAQLHLGNKYAVLVGDYFAIKAIYFAEKTKNNQVLLCVTQGVEDFASAPFFSNLINSSIWIPSVPSSGASLQDWANYNIKASGYFTGGLAGVLKVIPQSHELHKGPAFHHGMRQFMNNLALFVKLVLELEDFENESHLMVSPFLLVSLPAVLYQMKNPQAFNFLRRSSSRKNELAFCFDDLIQIREEIGRSDALPEAIRLMKEYGSNSKEALATIGQDEFYLAVFNDLIDALSAEVQTSVLQEGQLEEPLLYPMLL